MYIIRGRKPKGYGRGLQIDNPHNDSQSKCVSDPSDAPSWPCRVRLGFEVGDPFKKLSADGMQVRKRSCNSRGATAYALGRSRGKELG